MIIFTFLAKSKIAHSKQTGGGPPPPPLTTAEEVFLSHHGDDPAVVGIGGQESETSTIGTIYFGGIY